MILSDGTGPPGSDPSRSPVRRLCELAWHAPLAVASEVGGLVPQLARRGVESLATARHLSRFALRRDDPAVDVPGDPARTRAQVTLRSLGLVDAPTATVDAAPDEADGAAAETRASDGRNAPDVPAAVTGPGPASTSVADGAGGPGPGSTASDGGHVDDRTEPAPDGNASPDGKTTAVADGVDLAIPDLAIPDYDSLSASQVVPRLAGLSTAELEAVRRHEQGHRARRTILNKIAQLQEG